jgi:hypothetical protein
MAEPSQYVQEWCLGATASQMDSSDNHMAYVADTAEPNVLNEEDIRGNHVQI